MTVYQGRRQIQAGQDKGFLQIGSPFCCNAASKFTNLKQGTGFAFSLHTVGSCDAEEQQRRCGVLIRVMYKDNRYDYVQASNLEELIGQGKIKQFHRAEGWVTVGEDPIRGMSDVMYNGPERRRVVRAA
jgi:hypothetical protein